MAFITLAYVTARIRYRALLELTDDAETPQGKIIDAKIEQAITDVEMKVNNILRKKYVLPLTQLNDETDAYNDAVGTIRHVTLKCVMHTLYFQSNKEVPEPYANAFNELDTFETGESELQGCKRLTRTAVVSNKVSTDKIYSSETLGTI